MAFFILLNMELKWRKWNRAIHRDLGYFFFAMTIIYALSGIAINHVKDWNPNFIVTTDEFTVDISQPLTKERIKELLDEHDVNSSYRNHYKPSETELKVFLKDGSLSIDLTDGYAWLELSKKRPIFKPMNYLHYNPHIYWTWFSDIFCISLMILAISGLFIARGKKGITRRGAWLTALGILIPVIFLILFYY